MSVSEMIRDALCAVVGVDVEVSEGCSDQFRVELNVTVGLSGPPCGIVRLELNETTAHRLSAAMLCLDTPEESDDEMMRDAVGEIVNILAGRLKTIYGHESVLSMPVVSEGAAEASDHPLESYSGTFAVGDDLIRISTGWREA